MPLEAEQKLQIRTYCTRGDQTAINVLNFKVVSADGTMTEQDLVNGLGTRWGPKFRDVLASSATFYGVDLRPFIGPQLGATFWTKNGAGAGNAVGDVLPRQVSGLIAWQSALPGRHGKGRMYVPFPAEGFSGLNGTPEVLYTGPLLALATSIAGQFTVTAGGAKTCDVVLCIRNRLTNLFSPVAAATARNKWATMRSRGDYGRINPPPF